MDICIEKRSLFSEEEIINNINRNNTLYRSGKVSKSKKRSKRKRKRNKKRKKWPMLILILFFIFVYGTVTNIRNSNNLMIDKNNIDKEEFISRVEKVAVSEYEKSGILPSITISQAILESSWGNSRLSMEGNNLFGIKADKSWSGEKINFTTEEYKDNYEKADFRKYNSWEDSIKDHSKFLMENKRYLNSGLFNSKGYKEQAKALEDAGYATTIDSAGNKIYAEKLIRVIESYKLYEIDNKVINKSE